MKIRIFPMELHLKWPEWLVQNSRLNMQKAQIELLPYLETMGTFTCWKMILENFHGHHQCLT